MKKEEFIKAMKKEEFIKAMKKASFLKVEAAGVDELNCNLIGKVLKAAEAAGMFQRPMKSGANKEW